MGATPEGKKELIAVADGYRESEQSWRQLLLDCKQRGLVIDPKLAVGDGALGFWKAVPATLRRSRIDELERGEFGWRRCRRTGLRRNATRGPVTGHNLRGRTPNSCGRAGERRRVTVSADIHVHVVFLAVVEKRDGSVGALHAIEDNPRHRITPVVTDADVVKRLAVAVVDLE